MVILMKQNCTKENVQEVVKTLKNVDWVPMYLKVPKQLLLVFWVIKANWAVWISPYWFNVENCVPIMHSYKLASRDMCPDGRLVHVGDQVIGGKNWS